MNMLRVGLLAAVLSCSPVETIPSASPTTASARTAAPTVPPSLAAPEAAGCPVTLPATAWVAELAGFTPLPRSRFTWYGNTTVLAVDLPIDGVYRFQADSPNLTAKVAWWRYLSGTVSITAKRLDANAPEIRTKTTEGYGESGFNPSGIEFTSEGCWSVTGSLQGRELSFVMLVRRV